jgi:hypothetical protein
MFKNYKLSANLLFLLIILAATAFTAVLYSCNNKPAAPTLEDEIADGKELAKRYCSACHQLPDPSQLDRKSWEKGVLPAMAGRLRLHSYMGQYYADRESFITVADWGKIAAYYKNTAPANLVIPKHAITPLNDWAIFKAIRPEKTDTSGPPAMTTFVGYNTLDQKIYSGDASNNLLVWDNNLNSKLVRKMASPVTGAMFFKNDANVNTGIFTCIGVLPPLDQEKGKVIQLTLDNNTKDSVILGDNLPRPVQTVAADFNKDGLMDYVVCGFGHEKGGLYLLQQQANHQFKKVTIRNAPGGEQLITGDFNNDGWPDVMCLFAQADEGIWMFLNDHKGGFVQQALLQFPAIYGSSSFQLVDFNHDGKPDILYTCGDNTDYSPVLKPYHGVYIFTNDGNWHFEQTYFYQINGCTKAIAEDFDHDGDLDIAAIAFFADFKYHPQEGFIYLEQTKPNQFTAHQIPINKYGRWISMAVADIDHDGYDDIILGNFSFPGSRGQVNQKGFTPDWDKHEPIIVLKNIAGEKH